MQSFAKKTGFTFKVTQAKKRAWKRHEDLNIAVYRPHSGRALGMELVKHCKAFV